MNMSININNMELWKPIKEYEEYYQISSLGKVRSIRNDIILKYEEHTSGYRRVKLCKEGSQIKFYVHRLVAVVFIVNPDPENLFIVNHKDLNKKRNTVENLEWVTCSENIQHYYDSKKEADETLVRTTSSDDIDPMDIDF